MEMDFGPADNLVPLLEQELAGTWPKQGDDLTVVYRANTQASKTKSKPAVPGRPKPRKSNATTEIDMTEGDEDGAGADAI